MPAPNLSKITSKPYQLPRRLKDRLWNTREAAWFSSSSAISSFGSLGSLQTPPCISISLPAQRCQGSAILQQEHVELFTCRGEHTKPALRLLISAKTPTSQIVSFFFWISFSIDLEQLSQGYGKGPECSRSFHDICNSTQLTTTPRFLSYDLTHWEEFLSPSISLKTLPLCVSTKSFLIAIEAQGFSFLPWSCSQGKIFISSPICNETASTPVPNELELHH